MPLPLPLPLPSPLPTATATATATRLPSPSAWQILGCLLSSVVLFGAVFHLLPLHFWLRELDASQMGRVLLAWPLGLLVASRLYVQLSPVRYRVILVVLALAALLFLGVGLLGRTGLLAMPMLAAFVTGLANGSEWRAWSTRLGAGSNCRSLALARLAGAMVGPALAALLATRYGNVVALGILGLPASLAILLLQRGSPPKPSLNPDR